MVTIVFWNSCSLRIPKLWMQCILYTKLAFTWSFCITKQTNIFNNHVKKIKNQHEYNQYMLTSFITSKRTSRICWICNPHWSATPSYSCGSGQCDVAMLWLCGFPSKPITIYLLRWSNPHPTKVSTCAHNNWFLRVHANKQKGARPEIRKGRKYFFFLKKKSRRGWMVFSNKNSTSSRLLFFWILHPFLVPGGHVWVGRSTLATHTHMHTQTHRLRGGGRGFHALQIAAIFGLLVLLLASSSPFLDVVGCCQRALCNNLCASCCLALTSTLRWDLVGLGDLWLAGGELTLLRHMARLTAPLWTPPLGEGIANFKKFPTISTK